MLAILFSGGKDSVLTAFRAIREGKKIACLVTLKSNARDSYMFHIPAMNMVSLQAVAMGIPLIMEESSGIKEEELKDIERALLRAKKEFRITEVGAGALHSKYQYDRVAAIAKKLGIGVYAPLWQRDQEEHVQEIIDSGFDARIVGIASKGLDESWLGRRIDSGLLRELKALHGKYGVHIGGEGGEYESLVVDCPVFRERLELIETEKRMENECTGSLEIAKARLIPK
ncbi:Diphthamide synthase [uncultured archaeon]|nr:Diphthamide synthase [uncultured archaeon]